MGTLKVGERRLPVLALDWIAGRSLGPSVIDRLWAALRGRHRRPLPVRQAVRILDQILEATEALSTNLDLRPANILIERETGSAKVIDPTVPSQWPPPAIDAWPIKRILKRSAYHPPETTDPGKAGEVGAVAIYAAGSILYELLTGRKAGARPEQYRADELPAEVRGGWSLRSIVQTARARDPARRFATPRAMRDALKAFLGDGS